MIILAIIALIIGTGLLILECFIPGIGIPGIIGAILCILGIMALIPYIGWYIIFILLGIIIIVLLCIYFFARSADSGRNPFVLSSKTDRKSGFSANDDNMNLLNQTGITLTELRPSGIALINQSRVDVVTNGEFIEKNEKIIVCDIHGRRIIVKSFKEEI